MTHSRNVSTPDFVTALSSTNISDGASTLPSASTTSLASMEPQTHNLSSMSFKALNDHLNVPIHHSTPLQPYLNSIYSTKPDPSFPSPAPELVMTIDSCSEIAFDINPTETLQDPTLIYSPLPAEASTWYNASQLSESDFDWAQGLSSPRGTNVNNGRTIVCQLQTPTVANDAQSAAIGPSPAAQVDGVPTRTSFALSVSTQDPTSAECPQLGISAYDVTRDHHAQSKLPGTNAPGNGHLGAMSKGTHGQRAGRPSLTKRALRSITNLVVPCRTDNFDG